MIKKLFGLTLAVIAMSACEKGLEVKDQPQLEAGLEQGVTYHAGEPVKFLLSGQADMISLYSGEVYHDYTYKDGRNIDTHSDDVLLQFNSAVASGSQNDQLSILLSTDFNGDYSDINAVHQATWQDITGRFVLASGSSFTSSSVQSIKDLLQEGKPFYLAFRYITRPQAVNGTARQWMIENLNVSSGARLNNMNLVFANLYESGWHLVDENPVNAPARTTLSQTRITLEGNEAVDPSDPGYDPSNPWNDPQSENWVISKPFTFDVIQLGPDRPVAVKGVIDNVPEAYEYTFSEPGTYQVVFLAQNVTIKDQKQVIKTLKVTVEP